MEALQVKRVRLLASLTLMAGVGLLISLPFALRAGAEFFLPVTAALVVAIALVPMLEWFERRGVPSKLASVCACWCSWRLPSSRWLPSSIPRSTGSH